MRIRDSYLNQEPTFENRLLYAMYTNKYDDNAEEAWGFIDGARECLEGYKPIEELEEYIQKYEIDNSPLTIYDRGYLQAYRDFIKQEKTKECETNESI
jgi:hypothetical protein